ncbi:hypothetical protein BJ878DRAFT_31078 [Calycina marina]|uniref:Uncharacterized protein n=1 Tax=Calycina marina TaxID=1763456 RepID=A0A9P7Z424_9HELO|nr:hypothetical protein BJ878DRAFT_31078 [Calycina marina]
MAMSSNWSQAGPPPIYNGGHSQRTQPKSAPPPSCFVCNGPHFVVNCPTRVQSQNTNGPSAIAGYPGPAPNYAPQSGQWENGQGGAVQNSYGYSQRPAPAPQQYPPPPVQQQQYNNNAGSYGAPNDSGPPAQQYGYGDGSDYPPPYQQYGRPTTVQPPSYTGGHSAGPPKTTFQPPAPHNHAQACRQRSESLPVTIGPYHGTKGPPQPIQWNRPSPSPSCYPQQSGFQANRPMRSESVASRMSSQSQTPQVPEIDTRTGSIQPPPTVPASTPTHSSQKHEHLGYNGSQSNMKSLPDPDSDVAMSLDSRAASPQAYSRASTPYGQYDRRESEISPPGTSPRGSAILNSLLDHLNYPEAVGAVNKSPTKVLTTEEATAAVVEKDRLDLDMKDAQDFNWEYKKIFNPPPPFEFVALAQPIEGKYGVATPVPLLTEKNRRSVSRYVRLENIKDYKKPVRSQSQWLYLKEDPGFAEVVLDGPLIPLAEVRVWMAERHGEVPLPSEAPKSPVTAPAVFPPGYSTPYKEEFSTPQQPPARKRARSTASADGGGGTMQVDCSAESNMPKKKIKHEAHDENIVMDVIADIQAAPGTPTLARAGCDPVDENDPWAPQPGETADPGHINTEDDAEAILASLGVTGSAKPVRRQSMSHDTVDGNATGEGKMGSEERNMNGSEFQASGIPLPKITSPRSLSQMTNDYQQVVTSKQSAPSSQGFDGPPQSQQPTVMLPPVQGPLAQIQYPNYSFPQAGHAPPLLSQQGPLSQPLGQNMTNYGPSPQAQGYKQPGPYQNGPPQNHFGNGYGPPNQYQAAHPPLQHRNQYQQPCSQNPGPPQQGYGSYQNQQLPQQNPFDNGMPQAQYLPQNYQANEPYLQAQVPYGAPPPQNLGPGTATFGQPQDQWGPGLQSLPQNQAVYGGQPQQQPAYAEGHSAGCSFQNCHPQANHQQIGNQQAPQHIHTQQTGPPQQNQASHQPNGEPQTHPPRHDSGYASFLDSYSNGHPKPGNDGEMDGPSDDRPITAVSALRAEFAGGQGDNSASASEDDGNLSPISREVLGKLNGTYKKPEPMRQPDDGGTGVRRKPKRPQPSVAPAYSRRW